MAYSTPWGFAILCPMKKHLLPAIVLASFAQAAEVSFSGSMSADYSNNMDESWKPHNSANQDISLTTQIAFDEKTSVELYLASRSTVLDADSNRITSVVRSVEDGRSAKLDDSESRWGNIAFYGIQFQWEFSRYASLLVGDMTWSGGAMNYYGYSSSVNYGSITKDVTVRGIGFDLGGEGEVYLGAPDANNSAVWGFASYTFAMTDRTDEKWMVRPLGDMVFKNGGRARRWTLGVETQYSKSTQTIDYAISAAAGMIPFKDKKTYTLLAEPSMSYKSFSIGATLYQAFLANADSAISLQSDIPEERFASLEPSFKIHPKASIGLGGEYHDPSLQDDQDEYAACVPSVSLYPSEEMEITLWSKYRFQLEGADLFSVGVAASVEF